MCPGRKDEMRYEELKDEAIKDGWMEEGGKGKYLGTCSILKSRCLEFVYMYIPIVCMSTI